MITNLTSTPAFKGNFFFKNEMVKDIPKLKGKIMELPAPCDPETQTMITCCPHFDNHNREMLKQAGFEPGIHKKKGYAFQDFGHAEPCKFIKTTNKAYKEDHGIELPR